MLLYKRRFLHTFESMVEKDIVESFAHIQQTNKILNAVVHVPKKEEIENQIESRRSGNANKSSLFLLNVPFLVKDSIDVKGMPTVCGYQSRVGSMASQDANVVARLKQAGAVCLGKTNVPTGCLDMQTFNEVFGVTFNPYDTNLTPGGSSGGSAAAVAAGLVPLAVGSDLTGSLRVPSSFCGVASIKPTARRLSPHGHVPEVACMQNFLTVGAIAKDTAMLQRFMQAACCDAGGLWEDALPSSPFCPLPAPPPSEISVLLTTSLPSVPTQEAVTAGLEMLGKKLASHGVSVHYGAPELDEKPLFQAHRLFSELCVSISETDHPLKRPDKDRSPSASQLHKAEQLRHAARATFRETMDALKRKDGRKHAVWILPVSGVNAFKHNPNHAPFLIHGKEVPYWKPLLGYAFQAAIMGNPVVTLPIGLVEDVPMGVQVMGNLWQDEETLSVSSTLESIVGHHAQPALHASSFRAD